MNPQVHPESGTPGTRVAASVVLLSPMAVIAVGYLVAIVSKRTLDPSMAWLPPMIAYWLSLALAIAGFRGFSEFQAWLRPSAGVWGWRALSLINPIMIAVPSILFFQSITALPLWRAVAWLAIVVLNPMLEEGYWRATLMDSARKWPSPAVVAYSAFWFGLSHPLIMGINIGLVAGVMGFVGAFINGLVWSVVYYRTHSLRWCIISHVLANVFSIAIFLDLLRIAPP
jgi:membrane protease YdiL (CAAX protease family)